MAITKAPFYPLGGFWLDKSLVEAVYDVDGQKYHARQLGRYVYYHAEGADSIEQTCFVCCDDAGGATDWPSKAKEESRAKEVSFNAEKGVSADAVYPQAAFAAQVRAGECGRYALYSSRTYRDGDMIMLLRQDGAGTCLHEKQVFMQEAPEPQYRTDFEWDGRAIGISSPADILTAPWRSVAGLCEAVLRNQVLPRMADPFVSYGETPDEPFGWNCGSEQELERLTRCILHIHPRLFKSNRAQAGASRSYRTQNELQIRYKATTSQELGGSNAPPNEVTLCDLLQLAFKDNEFRGGRWERAYDCKETRRLCYKVNPEVRQFYVLPPSAHERAEAMLFLYDWLEDKVTEQERRRLLRLDPPTVRASGNK